MPYKIAGQDGTWYAPGERKGNANIAWRGQRPDGTWTEFVTDSRHQSGAQAHVRRFFEQWDRRTPPAAGAKGVKLEAAARHYKDAQAKSEVEKDRVDQIVRLIGKDLDIAHVNQTHLTQAARKFRRLRGLLNARARREGRQTFPLPSTPTINRELTTPLRAIVRFAAKAGWRLPIEIEAVKPEAGEVPSMPRPEAKDETVAALLRAIDHAVATLKPVGRRQLNYRRKLASLKALRALILVVHERGYRISEWLRWKWETINLSARMAKILLSKPTRWIEFDLSVAAVSVLSQMPAQDKGPVFPWRHRGQVYKAVDKLGIRWRPHESRRAVVTAVNKATGNVKAAQKYISHASINTTLRYVVVDPAETAVSIRTIKASK